MRLEEIKKFKLEEIEQIEKVTGYKLIQWSSTGFIILKKQKRLFYVIKNDIAKSFKYKMYYTHRTIYGKHLPIPNEWIKLLSLIDKENEYD